MLLIHGPDEEAVDIGQSSHHVGLVCRCAGGRIVPAAAFQDRNLDCHVLSGEEFHPGVVLQFDSVSLQDQVGHGDRSTLLGWDVIDKIVEISSIGIQLNEEDYSTDQKKHTMFPLKLSGAFQ